MTAQDSKPYERILVSAEQLAHTVERLASELNAAFTDTDEVLALVILEGARIFASDLLGQVRFPVQVEYLSASSYRGTTQSSGSVRLKGHLELADKLCGRKVLLIDDIYDTGLTLAAVQEWLGTCGPADVKTCVLLEKQIAHTKQIPIDFLGLTIEDCFVIGYGLDYQGRFRDLPFIAVLAL
ncbi:MAG: hypoxanthine phosphoribosyltransferase [Anaerohalosphaeraceae bacterium]